MTGDAYSRVKKLLSGCGISFTENGISNAEISAYCTAINLVMQNIGEVFNYVFIDTDNPDYFNKYIELLNLKSEYTNDELREKIAKRLKGGYGNYTKKDFDDAFKSVGSGKDEIRDGKIIFSDIDIDDLERLSDFIEGYVYVCTEVGYEGKGMTFADWDRVAKTFYKYDKLKLPFEILDKLRSDMIEQHKQN